MVKRELADEAEAELAMDAAPPARGYGVVPANDVCGLKKVLSIPRGVLVRWRPLRGEPGGGHDSAGRVAQGEGGSRASVVEQLSLELDTSGRS
jgi:hypothetical protein